MLSHGPPGPASSRRSGGPVLVLRMVSCARDGCGRQVPVCLGCDYPPIDCSETCTARRQAEGRRASSRRYWRGKKARERTRARVGRLRRRRAETNVTHGPAQEVGPSAMVSAPATPGATEAPVIAERPTDEHQREDPLETEEKAPSTGREEPDPEPTPTERQVAADCVAVERGGGPREERPRCIRCRHEGVLAGDEGGGPTGGAHGALKRSRGPP